MRKCTFPGCSGKHEARGWCRKHYMRWWRHGDPGRRDKIRRTCLDCPADLTGEPVNRKRCEPCAAKRETVLLRRRFRARWKRDPAFRARHNARTRLRKPWDASVTVDAVQSLLTRQRGRCALCTADLENAGYHVDHVMPLSKGGAPTIDNAQLLCPTCNRSKYTKMAVPNGDGQMVMSM